MPAEMKNPAAKPLNPTSAPASTSGNVAHHSPATIEYVDRADLRETFADLITSLIFDGQTLRIEFAVTRVDEIKPSAPIRGRRYPAARIVLTSNAAVDLINRVQQIAAALVQAGVMKAGSPPGPVDKKTA